MAGHPSGRILFVPLMNWEIWVMYACRASVLSSVKWEMMLVLTHPRKVFLVVVGMK